MTEQAPSKKKLYAKRDIIAQREHYTNHVMAMTAEELHAKSDIAAELAHRDIEVESSQQRTRFLERRLAAVVTWIEANQPDAFQRGLWDVMRDGPAHEPPADAHPEAFCEECHNPNAVWFAPSEIWNIACRDNGVLCPVCFIKKTEAAGIRPTSWKIAPEVLEESAQPPVPDEVAWLIEFTAAPVPLYFTAEGGGAFDLFDKDHTKAVRFARKTDAEKTLLVLHSVRRRDTDGDYVRVMLGQDCYKVTEHVWCSGPTEAPECQHDQTKPNPTVVPLGSAAFGSSDWTWMCTVCNDRFNLPVPSAQGEDRGYLREY